MSATYRIEGGGNYLIRYGTWDDQVGVVRACRIDVPPELWPMARLLARDSYLTDVLAQRLGSRTAAYLALAALRDMAAAAAGATEVPL